MSQVTKSTNDVVIFSDLPHPLSGVAYEGTGEKQTKVGEYQILPGRNVVAGRVWEAIKNIPGIQKRLDNGHLRTNPIIQKRDYDLLASPAPRSYISELSVKSGSQGVDKPIFGIQGNQNPQSQTVEALRAELKATNEKLDRLLQGAH